MVKPTKAGPAATAWAFSALTLLLLAAVFGILLATDAWRAFGIPYLFPPFEDLLGELAALDCHRRGFDVFVENPCDPIGRVHTYSSLWLLVPRIGIHDATWAGALLAAGTGVCAALVAGPRSLPEALAAGLLLASPAVLLGFERANFDLLVFDLLVAGLVLGNRTYGPARVLGGVATWLAAVLKLYPVAAPALLAAHFRAVPGRFRPWALVTVAVFTWMALRVDEIRRLSAHLALPDRRWSFGGAQLVAELGLGRPGPVVVAFAFLAILGIALMLARRLPAPDLDAAGLPAQFYLAGFAILAFCFVATVNFDYRLLFAVFLLPALFAHARPGQPPAWRRLALGSLALMLVIAWNESLVESMAGGRPEGIGHGLLLAEHLATWIQFVPLAALAIRLFPCAPTSPN